MDRTMFIYGVFGALAAIELYYAFRTKEVALPFFGRRRKKAANTNLYWAMIAFWAFILVSSLASAVSQ